MVGYGYSSSNIITVTADHYEFDIDPEDYGFDDYFDTTAYCYTGFGGYDL
jgi:hypothetical protein